MIPTILGMKRNLFTQYSLLIQHLVTCIRSNINLNKKNNATFKKNLGY
jgi:hypothetical protein